MEKQPNRGVLFKNDRKEKETHADDQGSAEIQCPHCQHTSEFYVDSWNNDKNGKKYQSLRFKVKGERRSEPARPASRPYSKPVAPKDPDLDSSDDSGIPF